MIKYFFFILSVFLLLSCSEKQQERVRYESSPVVEGVKADVEMITDAPDSSTEVVEETTSQNTGHHNFNSSSGHSTRTPDYFQQGYDDGYQDRCSLEKGRSYDNSLSGEDAREYRRGYFAGYPDGRADSDIDDDYLTGKNGADYYDTRDDEDWSEDGDFDDDDDGW